MFHSFQQFRHFSTVFFLLLSFHATHTHTHTASERKRNYDFIPTAALSLCCMAYYGVWLWHGIACDCIGMLFSEVHRLESALTSRKGIWTTTVTTVIFHRSATLYYAVELLLFFPPLLRRHSVRVFIVFQCIHNKFRCIFILPATMGIGFKTCTNLNLQWIEPWGWVTKWRKSISWLGSSVCIVSYHHVFVCWLYSQIRHRFHWNMLPSYVVYLSKYLWCGELSWLCLCNADTRTHTDIQADNNQNNVLSVPLCKSNRKRMEFLQWCCFYYMRVRVCVCVRLCLCIVHCFVLFYFILSHCFWAASDLKCRYCNDWIVVRMAAAAAVVVV